MSTTEYSSLLFYISCPSISVKLFSKDPRSPGFLLDNGISHQDQGTRCAHCYWAVPRSSQLTKLWDICVYTILYIFTYLYIHFVSKHLNHYAKWVHTNVSNSFIYYHVKLPRLFALLKCNLSPKQWECWHLPPTFDLLVEFQYTGAPWRFCRFGSIKL